MAREDCADCDSWLCTGCGGCFCPGYECDCDEDEDLFDPDELGLDPEEFDLPLQEKRLDA